MYTPDSVCKVSLYYFDIDPFIDFPFLHVCAPYIIRVCTATQKASVGMYSGCDTLSLQTLFMYFLALPSLLHPSILFNFFILITVLFF